MLASPSQQPVPHQSTDFRDSRLFSQLMSTELNRKCIALLGMGLRTERTIVKLYRIFSAEEIKPAAESIWQQLKDGGGVVTLRFFQRVGFSPPLLRFTNLPDLKNNDRYVFVTSRPQVEQAIREYRNPYFQLVTTGGIPGMKDSTYVSRIVFDTQTERGRGEIIRSGSSRDLCKFSTPDTHFLSFQTVGPGHSFEVTRRNAPEEALGALIKDAGEVAKDIYHRRNHLRTLLAEVCSLGVNLFSIEFCGGPSGLYVQDFDSTADRKLIEHFARKVVSATT